MTGVSGYHASLSQNRRAILASGLDPDNHLSPWQGRERGVYYFETLDQARFYPWNLACSEKVTPGPVDVWRLDLEGLWLGLDWIEGRVRSLRGRVLERVPPDRLVLVETLPWLDTETKRNLAVESRLHALEEQLGGAL